VGIWNIQLNDKKTAADAREFLPISLDNMPLVALASANVNPGHGGDQWFAVAYENKNVRIFRLSEGLKKSACDKLAQTYSTDQSVDSPRLGRRWQQLNAEKICSSSKVAGPISGLMQFLGRLVPGFFK
jgi:hypothetical protein